MKVVLNAEDVGLHPAVSRAAERLIKTGSITAVSLLANGEYLEEGAAVDIRSRGVHLDILRGRPVSHWQHVSTLCDENGSFLLRPEALFERYAMGKVEHSHVEKEWAAQIERVLDLGVRPSHLTSHKHVHGWPSLARMAAELAARYGIPWVRKPVECAEIARLDRTGFPWRFQSVCGFFDRESDGVNWTSDFVSLEELPEADWETVAKALGKMPANEKEGVVEIRLMPGKPAVGDPPIPSFCNPPAISAEWDREYRALKERDWVRSLVRVGWDVMGFPED